MFARVAFQVIVVASFAAPSFADPVTLGDYLASVDRTEVTYTGRIRYDRSERSFAFYDENREPFGATIDAGRDARERIERDCENSGFMVNFSELCTISGSGTVEIRGSRLFISIEVVDSLIK